MIDRFACAQPQITVGIAQDSEDGITRSRQTQIPIQISPRQDAREISSLCPDPDAPGGIFVHGADGFSAQHRRFEDCFELIWVRLTLYDTAIAITKPQLAVLRRQYRGDGLLG